MIIRQYFFLALILSLLILPIKESHAQDEFLYTCEYKSTKYVDHKVYGNESHFLNDYTKTLGWIKITNNDVKLSGIGWSQGMKFSSVIIGDEHIEINFQSKQRQTYFLCSKNITSPILFLNGI